MYDISVCVVDPFFVFVYSVTVGVRYLSKDADSCMKNISWTTLAYNIWPNTALIEIVNSGEIK